MFLWLRNERMDRNILCGIININDKVYECRRYVTASTSDSVRSIRLLFSSVRFSEDLFSSSPSPSSLNTLTSSVLPRSSPPLDETCGMVHSRRGITARYMAPAQLPVITRAQHDTTV